MRKIIIYSFVLVLIVCGCKKKPRTKVINEITPEPYSEPAFTLKEYIKAMNNNDFVKFNECHHPESRLKEGTGAYEKLKDELKNIQVTKYEVLQCTMSASGMRAQLRINWVLKYTNSATQEKHEISDLGRVIELLRFGKKWLISPKNVGKSFLAPPKITKEKVDTLKENGDGKEK